MMSAVLVADLHGNKQLYEMLLRIVGVWKISSVFIAGDLAPGCYAPIGLNDEGTSEIAHLQETFFADTFIPLFDSFLGLHRRVHVYAIMGNDDRRVNETLLLEFSDSTRNFHLVDDRVVEFRNSKELRSFFPGEILPLYVAGYPYVPPGAGFLMDWVKYDDRMCLLPPGMDPCLDLESWGSRTVDTKSHATIEHDLSDTARYFTSLGRSECPDSNPKETIYLFHSPPYNTPLDRIPPQGRYEFLSLPDHVGSTAIRRFIEREQPHLALCGHCHEAVVLGDYKTDIGDTRCANPGSQTHLGVLSLVQFDPYSPTDMRQLFINCD